MRGSSPVLSASTRVDSGSAVRPGQMWIDAVLAPRTRRNANAARLRNPSESDPALVTGPRSKPVRQSVTLPRGVARKVKKLAKARRTSASRVIVELVESGLEAADREKQEFLELAEQLAQSKNTADQKRLKAQLARLTFGD